MEALNDLHEAISRGDAQKVLEMTGALLQAGMTPEKVLNVGLIEALEKVGSAFASGELFLPEIMLSAHAVQKGMQYLEPLLAEAGVEPRGSVLIGTVKGDQHDIGKNIVAMMLRGAGFRVKDLGVDVDPQRFVAEVREGTFQIVAMSTLLMTCLPWTQKTIEAVDEAGLRSRVKILVGGAVMDAKRARESGADAYAPDAARAVDVSKELLGLS
jgi:5-methyltetrahydrofolate--homocysteine methyltransferase